MINVATSVWSRCLQEIKVESGPEKALQKRQVSLSFFKSIF